MFSFLISLVKSLTTDSYAVLFREVIMCADRITKERKKQTEELY